MAAQQELRRLRYLQAMGHPVLVTRRPLPGAAPSPKLALRQRAAPAATTSNSGSATVAPRPAAAPGALREMLRQNQSATSAPPPVSEPAVAPASAAVEPATRFSLAVLVCAKRLWVEELGDDALAREQVQLVSNLGRALIHPEQCPAATVGQFTWPLHDNGQFDLGTEEAAATLAGYLTRQLDDHQCVELLCLGEAARERVQGLRLPCAMRSLPGSRQILEAPLLKRDLWAELAPS